jgi:subtilisin family serine protease
MVAAGLSKRDLLQLVGRGFRIGEQTEGKLGARVVRLVLPKGMSVTTARRIVSALDRAASVEPDDYYYTDGFEPACTAPQCLAPQMIGWTEIAGEACGTVPVIGMIDTRIDIDQPALAGQPIEMIDEPGATGAPSSADHATAIAALLIGRQGSATPGLLPGARLIAIDAFYQAGGRERTDVERLIAAIEMLSDRGVRVINLSLSGPPNKLLEQAIAAAIAKDIVVVAAAGNKGPGAEPAYPAAYPGVIAVTAVDRDLQIYARATHGNYIGLAAPGVDVWTASVPDGGGPRSGTSYAVPFVSAAAAVLRARHPDLAAGIVKGTLYASARDLGGKGHDPVFGWGLVQAGGLCAAPADQAANRSAAEVEPGNAIAR